ncbi:MAG: YeeE/YedE family protein, partial [Deltaproteobacteria bacterium]|nr:YeeE/YedE family protein [Deltaproteobacteria bacterium]
MTLEKQNETSAGQGVNVTESILDQPLWETIAQKLKQANLTNNKGSSFSNPYFAGMGIGIALFLAFFLVGRGFGDSGAMTRIFAYLMSKFTPEHTDTLYYFKRYLSTSGHPLYHWVVFVLIGSAIGGLVSGLKGKRMKMEFIRGPNVSRKRRIITSLIGGILVAFGARMAGGCVTGLAITSGSLLSVAGWLFFFVVISAGML